MITETTQDQILAEALWYLSLFSKACEQDIQDSLVFCPGMPQREVFTFDHDPLLPVACKPAHCQYMLCHGVVLGMPSDDMPQHLFECSLVRQVNGA